MPFIWSSSHFEYKPMSTCINVISTFSRLDAFIWDSSRLEYEAAKDCDLITAGELFGRSGLGVGLEKKSPWTHEISMAILTLHESKILYIFCPFRRICVPEKRPSREYIQ